MSTTCCVIFIAITGASKKLGGEDEALFLDENCKEVQTVQARKAEVMMMLLLMMLMLKLKKSREKVYTGDDESDFCLYFC